MTIAYPDTNIWRGKDWSAASPDELAWKADAEAFGWRALQALMGGAVSITPITLRPNQPTCSPRTYYVAPVGAPGILDPYVGANGRWYNRGLSWKPEACECEDARRIRLPGPIGRVEAVLVDGVAVPTSAYQVVDNEWLVRTDGKGWPRHQDMYAAPTAANTFTVRYFRGTAPDDLDAFAAGVLALEFYNLLRTGDKSACRLPRNATSVVRQGVTMDLSTSGFADGKSGIPEVDAIVSMKNPYLLRTPAVVMSIDTIPRGRVTQGAGVITPTPPEGSAGSLLVPDPENPGYYLLQAA